MIEIENLSLSLGGAPILRDVTLTIPKGGIAAIIGPNGAGKSTLLHCLAGLLTPDRGQVRLDGMDVHRARESARARMLSLLTQSPGAVPRLTVTDLVSFGRWPHHRGRPGPEDAAIVADAMTRFDLLAQANRDVETLSGGQRQRAFVAMAFAQSTPWMLLDEPLSALDPKFAHDIMNRLRQIAASTEGPAGTVGRSVLLVLHDLQIALRNADWVVALKDGQVAHAGPTAEVMTSENLTALYETDLQVTTAEGTPVVIPR